MRLQDLASVAIVFVVAGIALAIGAEVIADIQAGLTPGVATNATANVTAGLAELASWMPTIGLVIAAALVIGIIFQSFGGRI